MNSDSPLRNLLPRWVALNPSERDRMEACAVRIVLRDFPQVAIWKQCQWFASLQRALEDADGLGEDTGRMRPLRTLLGPQWPYQGFPGGYKAPKGPRGSQGALLADAEP